MVYCVAAGCSSNSCSKKAGSVSFFSAAKRCKVASDMAVKNKTEKFT